jgi:hypothetical protein
MGRSHPEASHRANRPQIDRTAKLPEPQSGLADLQRQSQLEEKRLLGAGCPAALHRSTQDKQGLHVTHRDPVRS